MGRIADILTRVRDSLADPSAQRWSDARLLRLIDEAQTDIAVKNGLLRTKVEKNILVDINTYQLPSHAAKISRVVNSDGKHITVKSHTQMDFIDPTWETTTGNTIEYIVFDKLNPGVFKVYPIPTESSEITETFTFNSDYGLAGTISDDVITPDYGVVGDVTETATKVTTISSPYGVITDMETIVASLLIYYTKRPTEITAIDIAPSVLEIHDIYDKAIKHYTIGMAWRDDQDTQNRQLGKEELGFYAMEFLESRDNSASDNLNATQQTTQYNDGFR